MKLTCTITPSAERTVVFEEASALYAWSVYDVTVVAEAFRGLTADASLQLSHGGEVYTTAKLVADPSRADVRVGTLSLNSQAYGTLFSALAAENSGTRVFTRDFAFAVTCDAVTVADDTVQVVVTSRPSSSGGGGVVVDSALDAASTNPVENSVITKAMTELGEVIQCAAESATTAMTTVQSMTAAVESAKRTAESAKSVANGFADRVSRLESTVEALGTPYVMSDDTKSKIMLVESVVDSDTVGVALVTKVNKVVAALRSLAGLNS